MRRLTKDNLLQNPTPEKAAEHIRKALSSNKVIVVIGDCSIDYKGRASSKISWGERIIIIKEDQAVLVHRPYGYEPVNWQPAGSYIDSIADRDKLTLRIIRKKPLEKLEITFRKIYSVLSYKLSDNAIFHMYGEEEDLKKAIVEYPELIEKGIKIIDTERKTGNGYVDILAKDINERLVVMELKKVTAGEDAVRQLRYYVDSLKSETGKDVRGILVAPRISKRAIILLKRYNLEFKRIDLKKVTKLYSMKNNIVKYLGY